MWLNGAPKLSDSADKPLSNEAVKLIIWTAQNHNKERAEFQAMTTYANVLRRENEFLRSREGGKHGNPALMGMSGFATCCFLLQMTNLGLMGVGPIIYVGLIYGAFCLFMAGMQELRVGSVVRATGFCTFGSFWFCIVATRIYRIDAPSSLIETEVGWVVTGIACMIAILLVSWWHHSLVMALMFVSLLAGYVVTDVANFSHSPKIRFAAGAILMVSACCAYYTVAHIILHEAFGREILPLMPSMETICRRVFKIGLDCYIPRHKSSLVYEFNAIGGILYRVPTVNIPPPRKFGVG